MTTCTEWTDFKGTADYKELLKRSAEKSAEEIELKNKRDGLRFSLLRKRRRGASEEELAPLQREFDEAKIAYAATGRAGRRRGVAHHL